MLGIFFANFIYITLQKKSFTQNTILIPCTGSKVPFWQFFNLGSCEYLTRLESRIRKWLFFDGSLLKKYSVSQSHFNKVLERVLFMKKITV
jgi:hypothetical protein